MKLLVALLVLAGVLLIIPMLVPNPTGVGSSISNLQPLLIAMNDGATIAGSSAESKSVTVIYDSGYIYQSGFTVYGEARATEASRELVNDLIADLLALDILELEDSEEWCMSDSPRETISFFDPRYRGKTVANTFSIESSCLYGEIDEDELEPQLKAALRIGDFIGAAFEVEE